MAYQELSTKIYWDKKVDEENQQLRDHQRREAISSFINFIVLMIIATLTACAIATMPLWLPGVEAYLAESPMIADFKRGLIEIHKWLGFGVVEAPAMSQDLQA